MSRKAMRNYLKAVSQRVDRKKMYKAKKQWIVAGMSFLVAMGIGTAVNVNSHASTVDSANAPVTKVANQKPQIIQHQAKQLHNQVLANTSLNNDKMIHNTNSTMTHNINNGDSASAKSSGVAKPASTQSSLDSQKQASSVESNVASSASQSSNSMRGGVDSVSNVVKPSSNATKVNPVVSASAKGSVSSTGVSASNSTSNQVAKSAVSGVGDSKSVVSNIRKPVSPVSSNKVTKGFGAIRRNKPLMLDASNDTAKATDNNWIYSNGKYLSDGQVNDWATYTSNVNSNLTFKYSPSTQALEYVSGTVPNKYHFTSAINWTGTEYVNGHKESQSTASIPQPISLKIDSGIDISKVTDMSSMFANDSDLQSLDLGNNFDTSKVTDMTKMFYSDSNLQSLNLGNNFNTGNVTNMSSMFSSNNGLQSLDLGNHFNTSKVTDMHNMFCSDQQLQLLNLGNQFNTNNVADMGGMFDADSVLQSLNLGNNFDTSKVTDMDAMFSGDQPLRSLNLGNHFNTSKVTDMDNMFSGDSALQSLNLGGNFYTNNVTNMSSMFSGDNALQSLDLGNHFNTSNVTNMSDMFDADDTLQSLDLPSSFNTTNVSDMFSMFSSDSALQSLDLGDNFNTSNVTNMSDMFSSDNALNKVIIDSPSTEFDSTAQAPTLYQETGQNDSTGKPYTLATANDFSEGNVGTFIRPKNVDPRPVQKVSYSDIYSSSDGLSSNVPQSTITPKSTDLGSDWAYVNAQGIESKTPIKNAQGHVMIAPVYEGLVYHYNKNNQSVEFTSGTANSNLSGFCGNAPSDIKKATSIKFGDDIDISKVNDMTQMFNSDSNLRSLNLGNNFDVSHITDMSNMFSADSSLRSIDLGNKFDTSNVTNMYNMFGHDINLPSLNLGSNFNTSNVSDMSDMFSADSSLQSIDLGNKFNTSKVTNMSDMFGYDIILLSLNLGNKFNTSNVTNMNNMFSWDEALQSLDLGNKFNTGNVTNMNNMFGSTFNLNKVTIDSSLTKFNKQSMMPRMYQETNRLDSNNKPYTLATPNDFTKGNVGTFIRPKNVKSLQTTINYINQNGTNVGTQKNQNAKGANISLNIPNGYHLNNNTSVTANGGTQNVNVTGNQVSIQGTLHLIYNNKQGSNLINTNKVDKPITINGNVGNTVQVADPFDYIEVGYGLPSTLTPWSVAITNNMGKQSHSFTYNGQIAGQLTVIYTDVTPGHVKSDVGHQVLGDLGNEGQVIELAPNTNHDTKFDSSTGNRVYDVLQTPTGFTLEKNLNYITLQLHKNPMKLTLSLSEPVIHHHVTPKVVKPTNHDKKNHPNKPVITVINHKKTTPVKPDTHKVIRPKYDNKNQVHKVVAPKKPNKVINDHKVIKPNTHKATQPVVNHKSNNKKPVTPIKPKNHVVPAKPKTNNTHKSVSPVKPTDSKANANKQTKSTKVISHKNKPVAPINHKSDSTKPVAKKNNKQVVSNKVNKNQPKAHESVTPLKPNVPTVINTSSYQSDNNAVKALVAKLEVKPEVKNDDATVSFKPKQFINHQVTNLNKIKVGHMANYRGMRVERIRGLKRYHFNRYVRIYNNIKLGHKAYAKSVKASKIRVIRAYKIHGKHGKYIRYEVRIGKRNYFVSGRALKHHVIRKHLRKLIHHFKHLR